LSSNIGLWAQNVAGSWDMTSLSPSPTAVALMQTASSLPVFLVGLPAAALSDIFNRRRLLLFISGWMALTSVILSALASTKMLGPTSLLGLTFALGLGAAMGGPIWQSVLPNLVDKPQLPAAVTLSGVAINIARAAGPAIGGMGIGLFGTGAVYLFNAVAFSVVMIQVARWKYEPKSAALPPERVTSAVIAGLRFARHAPALRAVLVRAAAFILPGSALWALLPVVARRELHMGPLAFGVLSTCVGSGALLGAAWMPKIRARLSSDALVFGATLVYAPAMLALAYLRSLPALYTAMFATGLSWIALMSSLNVAAVSAAPGWVQGRALGLFLLVFQGGMASGSLLWGALASRSSSIVALSVAAGLMVVGSLTTVRYRLSAAKKDDVEPWAAWPDPVASSKAAPEVGPVLVQRAYQVSEANRTAFLRAMQALSTVRRRDGALTWGLFEDASQPGRYLEHFTVASWVEHLRQHQRTLAGDRKIEEEVQRLGSPHSVEHWIDAFAVEGARERNEPIPAPEPDDDVALGSPT